MSDKGWESVHLSEIGPVPGAPEDLEPWRPVRHTLGVLAFGVNAWVGESKGDRILEEHDELNEDAADNHEELYLVLEGHATFTVDGEMIDAPRGTFVFVRDPALVRTAFAEGDGTTVLAIGATPGYPFRVSPWEKRHTQGSSV
ncbi:MAG TPA: hypothetical protein VH256_04515 [Thermoleophilaceae bacterium]|nr:hypothetical protein [Thermoleophilaceae bacterium]